MAFTYRPLKFLSYKIYSCVTTGSRVSRDFKMTEGVRQGSYLTVSKIYLNVTPKQCAKKCQHIYYLFGMIKCFTLLFANDQVIMVEDTDDMVKELSGEYEQ